MGIRQLVPNAGPARGSVCGDAGGLHALGVSDAVDPRVFAVFVDLADFVGVGVLVVELDVVLAAVVAVGDCGELRVLRGAVLAVEFTWEPAATRDPAVLGFG